MGEVTCHYADRSAYACGHMVSMVRPGEGEIYDNAKVFMMGRYRNRVTRTVVGKVEDPGLSFLLYPFLYFSNFCPWRPSLSSSADNSHCHHQDTVVRRCSL